VPGCVSALETAVIANRESDLIFCGQSAPGRPIDARIAVHSGKIMAFYENLSQE